MLSNPWLSRADTTALCTSFSSVWTTTEVLHTDLHTGCILFEGWLLSFFFYGQTSSPGVGYLFNPLLWKIGGNKVWTTGFRPVNNSKNLTLRNINRVKKRRVWSRGALQFLKVRNILISKIFIECVGFDKIIMDQINININGRQTRSASSRMIYKILWTQLQSWTPLICKWLVGYFIMKTACLLVSHDQTTISVQKVQPGHLWLCPVLKYIVVWLSMQLILFAWKVFHCVNC